MVFRVIGSDGRPLTGVPLAVEFATAAVPELGIVTDDDGRAAIALPLGAAGIVALLPSGVERRVTVEVSRDEGAEITIRQ